VTKDCVLRVLWYGKSRKGREGINIYATSCRIVNGSVNARCWGNGIEVEPGITTLDGCQQRRCEAFFTLTS
jgi:hypothetical protein